MMWNGVKVGKVGTINIKSLKMLSLSCELILYYYARKTVSWHYQDNDVTRVAFGCCVCRILCLRALVHRSVVVLLVRTVGTCDCSSTCMYYFVHNLAIWMPYPAVGCQPSLRLTTILRPSEPNRPLKWAIGRGRKDPDFACDVDMICRLGWRRRAALVSSGPAHHRGEFALVQVRGPGLSCLRPGPRFKLPLAPGPV
jgi:hypothetical protein